MSYWRDLRVAKAVISSAELVLSIPLKRDFSDVPAYWIEVFRIPQEGIVVPKLPKRRVKLPDRYVLAKQWGYKKSSGEIVQDATISKGRDDLDSILLWVEKAVLSKLDAGWQHASVTPTLGDQITEREERAVASYNFYHIQKKEDQPPEPPPPEPPKTLKDRFKESQRRRQKKAEW